MERHRSARRLTATGLTAMLLLTAGTALAGADEAPPAVPPPGAHISTDGTFPDPEPHVLDSSLAARSAGATEPECIQSGTWQMCNQLGVEPDESAVDVVGEAARARASAESLNYDERVAERDERAREVLRNDEPALDDSPGPFIPAWCLDSTEREVYAGDRSEACGVWPGIVTLTEFVDGVPMPRGFMNYSLISNVYASPDEGIWYHDYAISKSFSYQAGGGVMVSQTFGCEGLCIADTEVRNPTTLPLGKWLNLSSKSQTTVALGDATIGTSTWRTFFTHPQFPLPLGDAQRPMITPLVRCDRSVVFQYTPGCVIFEEGHGMRFWQYEFPEWAAHVAMAQYDGLPGAGRAQPLHRLVDSTAQNYNRSIACPDEWVRPEGKTCDEYPFASTYEGAGFSGPGGLRTFFWCEVPEPATPSTGSFGWSSCMINADDNSDQGTEMARQFREGRILDGDEFWVEIWYIT